MKLQVISMTGDVMGSGITDNKRHVAIVIDKPGVFAGIRYVVDGWTSKIHEPEEYYGAEFLEKNSILDIKPGGSGVYYEIKEE